MGADAEVELAQPLDPVLLATGAAGGNNNLKVYTNNITDVNIGIVHVGPTAAADQNTSTDIGGVALATGNTITNFGTTGTFSGYANVSGTVNGILVRNSKKENRESKHETKEKASGLKTRPELQRPTLAQRL